MYPAMYPLIRIKDIIDSTNRFRKFLFVFTQNYLKRSIRFVIPRTISQIQSEISPRAPSDNRQEITPRDHDQFQHIHSDSPEELLRQIFSGVLPMKISLTSIGVKNLS